MPLIRYVPAMVIGCIAWAVVYATVGLAAVGAALTLAARSPWVLVVTISGVIATVVLMVHRRRKN